jgi:hypothetical protein
MTQNRAAWSGRQDKNEYGWGQIYLFRSMNCRMVTWT